MVVQGIDERANLRLHGQSVERLEAVGRSAHDRRSQAQERTQLAIDPDPNGQGSSQYQRRLLGEAAQPQGAEQLVSRLLGFPDDDCDRDRLRWSHDGLAQNHRAHVLGCPEGCIEEARFEFGRQGGRRREAGKAGDQIVLRADDGIGHFVVAVGGEQLQCGGRDGAADLPIAILQLLGDDARRGRQVAVHHQRRLAHGTAIGEPHTYRQDCDNRHDQPRHQIEAQTAAATCRCTQEGSSLSRYPSPRSVAIETPEFSSFLRNRWTSTSMALRLTSSPKP